MNRPMERPASQGLFRGSVCKQEEIYINEYRTPRELRHAVGEYIRKYNTIRPHQALDNKTPDDVYYTPFSRSATNIAGLDSAPLAC